MNGRQKIKLDALHRIQVFMQQNVDALGVVNLSGSRAALDDAVVALEAKIADQVAAQVGATSATVQKNAARGVLLRRHMQPIAVIARGPLAGTPLMTTLKRPRKRVSDATLIAAGMAMATTAALYPEAFANEQLPEDFIAQLNDAVAAVQGAVSARNGAWQQLRAATQGVEDQLVLARHTVDVLNALVVRQLEGKTNLLAAWQMAKQRNAKPGVVRGTERAKTPASATEAPVPAEPVMAKAA